MGKINSLILYPVGARDVQILKKDDNDQYIYSKIPQEHLAETCNIIMGFIKDGKKFKIASLSDPRFKDAKERFFKNDDALESVFTKNTEFYFCFPIFESTLNEAIKKGSELKKIYLFNTNRQDKILDREYRYFAEKEPYAFSKIIMWCLPHLWTQQNDYTSSTCPDIEEIIVLKNKILDKEKLYPYLDQWFEEKKHDIQSFDKVYLLANPGIPAVGNIISMMLSMAIPPQKMYLLEKTEGEKAHLSRIPFFDQIYRDKQAILTMVSREYFHDASQKLKFSSLSTQPDIFSLLLLAEAGKQGIKSIIQKNRKKIEDKFKTMPEWTEYLKIDNSIYQMLVRSISYWRQKQYDATAVLLCSAFELSIVEAIKQFWPGAVKNQKKKLVFQNDPASPPEHLNFSLYTKLLNQKKSYDNAELFLSYIKKSRSLRNARNGFIHNGKGVQKEVILKILNIKHEGAAGIENIVVSEFISLIIQYMDLKISKFVYWPQLAAEDIQNRIKKSLLIDLA